MVTDMDDPHITIESSDFVTLEWWHNKKSLTLFFYPKRIEYLMAWGPHIWDEMEHGDNPSGEKLDYLFARLEEK